MRTAHFYHIDHKPSNMFIRQVSIVKNIHLSTLHLGLWWEGGEIVEILRTLLYDLGMPAERLQQIIVTDDPEEDGDNTGSTVVAD